MTLRLQVRGLLSKSVESFKNKEKGGIPMSTGTLNCISAVLLALAVVAGIRSLYLFHYSTLSRLKYLIGSSESKFMLIR